MRAQPQLLKSHRIQLLRWSRPSTGLTRTDQFNYLEWLRDDDALGAADFCIVQLGANDLQTIAVGAHQFAAVGSAAWQDIYAGRVVALTSVLQSERCTETVWLLQPHYTNQYLSRYTDMINQAQCRSLKPTGISCFQILTTKGDFCADGVHFSGPFALKLAQALAHVYEYWKFGRSCASHSPSSYRGIDAFEILPLVREGPGLISQS